MITSNETTIPTVDLAAFVDGNNEERRQIAEHVDGICRSIGFLIIENHGVSRDISDTAWSVARRFFDLPLAEKLASQPLESGSPRGYFPIEQESLAKTQGIDTPPDPKECYSSGPLSPPGGHSPDENFDFFYGPNLWPANPAEFGQAWVDYYGAMEQLGSQIMQMLAMALRLNENYFVDFHTHHVGALRALNYPEVADELQSGQQRAGAHSDYGSLTILKPDPLVGGLEVQQSSGNWISAPTVEDGFIVNIGDLLARWTNDRWVSTMHRVTDSARHSGRPAQRRQSIAYFMNPNYDAKIDTIPTCLKSGETTKYPSVLAGQYLVEKFGSAIQQRPATAPQ